MMKKLLPIAMLLLGSGAGVGAGIFLRPTPVEDETVQLAVEANEYDKEESEAKAGTEDKAGAEAGMEYVKLPNQFVVPLVEDQRISALVVMSLSVEVALGSSEEILNMEPKLRDGFLRILFDHATIGGFHGAFINNENLDTVRKKLRDVARVIVGGNIVNDILIFEIARQDY